MPETLIITFEYPPQIGGVSSYVYNLATHLPATETVVLAPKAKGSAEFDASNPWKTHRVEPYWPFFWPRWSRLFFAVWKIIRKENIERIFIHNALPAGYVATFFDRFYKIPFTVFFHGTDLLLGARFKKFKLAKICAKAEKIVVNSEFLRERLETEFEELRGSKKVAVLHPSPGDLFFTKIPPEEIDRLKSRLSLSGKKIILSVARLGEGKGLPLLMSFLPEILAQIPNVVWLIIGDGPKKQMLLEQARKNSLQDVVRFLGPLPQEELPKYYQAADVFVLLTHTDEAMGEEAWGTVFLEAAASGLAAVAGKTGGVEEAVEHGRTGLVLNVNRVSETIAAIVGLLRDDALSKKMGEEGKKRTENEFRWASQIKNILV